MESPIGLHMAALMAAAKRHGALSSNIANADTPGYKARDVDFASELGAQMRELGVEGAPLAPAMAGSGKLARTDGRHLAAEDELGDFAERAGEQAAADGNTVDTAQEKAKMAANALVYETQLRFLGHHLRQMQTASS